MNSNNYRGIILLSIISKIYESIFNVRLYNYVEINKLDSLYQCGFKKKKDQPLIKYLTFLLIIQLILKN